MLLHPSEREDWKREWEGELGAVGAAGPGLRVGTGRVLAAATEDGLRLSLRRIRPGSWAQDVRFALRTVRTRPAYAFAALLTFALGIGANVAMFTVINAYVLRPFPIEDPDRIVWLNDFKEGRAAPLPRRLRGLARAEPLVPGPRRRATWSATLTELEWPMRVSRAWSRRGLRLDRCPAHAGAALPGRGGLGGQRPGGHP